MPSKKTLPVDSFTGKRKHAVSIRKEVIGVGVRKQNEIFPGK
tara:strand:- start:199 stop:324 length:126 start_codon:yes stop_codon:yes gene_type:complete